MNRSDKLYQLLQDTFPEEGPGTGADERILHDASTVMKQSHSATKRQNSVPKWRRFMKNPLTKISTAAVVVLTTYLCLQIPKDLVAPAYALQDTIKAYNSIRTLHVKAFRTVYEQKWDSESWIEFDEYGNPRRFRHQANRISTGNQIGPLTLINDGDGVDAWLPILNLCFRRSGESVSGISLLQWEISDVDPKLVCEKLQERARDGEILLDVNEPDQKSEPIVLTVTYPAESRSVNWKKVLYINQTTRLVKKEEVFEKRDGQFQHERTTEFFDYNEQIDSTMFSLKGKLPENVVRIDQSGKEVGLAQGEMTDEEIVEEVTLQFLKAANAGDFNKLGQLYLGVPAFLIKKLSGGDGGGNESKIVSIGPVNRNPDPDSNILVCPCKSLGEEGGQYYEVDMKIHVQPVSDQPGRWMICGTTTHTKPALGETALVEYEPTTEEWVRGFVVVQGRGPESRPRLERLEVDLGRNERDLAPVKLVGLSELDTVSIRLSGPGASLCRVWIEKDYQLHAGTQTPLGSTNPARIWLDVDSDKHDPGVYDLTISLSSGQGTELRIPGTVTIHDVALPQERTVGVKPFWGIFNESGGNIHKPETRKLLEVFLDDLAVLRTCASAFVKPEQVSNCDGGP